MQTIFHKELMIILKGESLYSTVININFQKTDNFSQSLKTNFVCM